MGRELRRVLLDFDHPVGQPWPGFLNPLHSATKCAHCDGTGYSPEARHMHDLWYGYAPFKPEDRGSVPWTADSLPVRAFAERNVRQSPEYYGTDERAIATEARRLAALFNEGWNHHLNQDDVDALVEAGRLMDLTHTFTAKDRWQPKNPPYHPTAAEVNAWSIGGMGHDSINNWIVIKAECKRLGVPETCAHCDGEGELWSSPEAKQAYEDWQPTPPPEGEGYQIWETVSEGSPISPVFSTPEDLARHMATTSWGADEGTSVEQWLRFINGPGWAPSMVMHDGVMETGVQAFP
jgi:hypothetical protein